MQHPDDWNQDYPIRDTDLSRSFEKLKEFMRPYYHRGQRFDREAGGFSFRGESYPTLQDAYSAIDPFLDESDKTI